MPIALRTPWSDAALALAVGVVQAVGATQLAGPHEPHARQINALGLILLVATPLALVVRRRWPLQVYAVAFVATVSYQAFGYVLGPDWLGFLVAFVTVAMAGHRRIAVAGLLAVYVLSQWLPPLLGTGHAPSLALALAVLAWLLVLFGASEWVRWRRLRSAAAARLRQEEERRRVSEERLRMSRSSTGTTTSSCRSMTTAGACRVRPGDGDHRHDRARGRARRVPGRRPAPGGRIPGARVAPPGRGAMIRVLLADDQALVRAGFASLLATQDDIEVVGEAADGAEAVRQARTLVPDVVLSFAARPGHVTGFLGPNGAGNPVTELRHSLLRLRLRQ